VARTAQPAARTPKAARNRAAEDGSEPLANARSELFAQYRALAGASVTDAYILSGGKTNSTNAKGQGQKYAAKPEVKARIAWLKLERANRMLDDNVMGKREILEELKTNMHLGRTLKGGLTASNRALELIGSEEHDMFVQKRESRSRKIDELDDMGPEQVLAYIERAVKKIPGLEIDIEGLARACGIEPGPASGDRRAPRSRALDSGSPVPESEDL